MRKDHFDTCHNPTGKLTKLYLGTDLAIPQDHGPTGKPMSHGKLDYTGPDGTVLYTVTNDGISETPLVLAMALSQNNGVIM